MALPMITLKVIMMTMTVIRVIAIRVMIMMGDGEDDDNYDDNGDNKCNEFSGSDKGDVNKF